MAKTKVQQFLDTLGTYDHKRGMALFEAAVKDLDTARTALLGVLLEASNQHPKDPVTPHAMLTADAGRQIFERAGWPASLPVLRFLALYNFTLTKRDWTPRALSQMAGKLRIAKGADLGASLARAMGAQKPEEAAAIAVALAEREGMETARHALVAATLGDIGRLQHNLTMAVAYAETSKVLGEPAGRVPLANGAYEIAALMTEYEAPRPDALEAPPAPADSALERLERALDEGEFEEVHAQLKGFATTSAPEEAVRPLLVAACLEPGFLGHNLIAAHTAGLALPYLTPEQRAFLLWKFYRVLVSRFGYPEGLLLREGSEVSPGAAVEALKASLKIKTPPVERTLRDALESGVPLEKVLQHVTYNWTNWTIGEKEHTLQYLNAAVQTTAFLGRERAMLPLVSTLYKLPF